MKYLLTLWLSFCLIWLPLASFQAPARAAELSQNEIRAQLPDPEQLILVHMTPVLQPALQTAPTESDYWLNSAYAMGGSAAGNGLIILTVLLLDLLPTAFANADNPPGDWIGAAGPWLYSLGLIPLISTPLTMHLYSPDAHWENYLWTSLGTLAGMLVQGLIMWLFAQVFQQESGVQTFYLLSPVLLLSGLIFEGLTAAQFHQFAEEWRVSQAPGGGLMLSRRLVF